VLPPPLACTRQDHINCPKDTPAHGRLPPPARACCRSRKALPFFLYAYVDKDIIVGRGRGGGLAVWGRADAEWTVKTGVASVYK
jgi:hypothetical protein